jgi:uncharacterized protein (DUF488 family)
MTTVFTIGHSTHRLTDFQALLRRHNVTAICDVRSTPFSRTNPQFNRENLKTSLPTVGMVYVFLGAELGARSTDPECYVDGKVQYERLARTELFRKGIDRIRDGIREHRIALMCAEKDPLQCHRTILVARHLDEAGIGVEHIRENGRLESHDEALSRLISVLKLSTDDMFRSRRELIEDAYRAQGERIAFVTKEVASKSATSPNDDLHNRFYKEIR